MWKYVTYLKKGLSHEVAGTKCQDSVIAKEDEYCIVAALADGLGSLKHSDIAANLATNLVWELFSSLKNEKIIMNSEEEKQAFAKQFVDEITFKIKAQADVLGVLPETMDCTLVFVYISKRHNYAVVGRLGDSAICVIKESKPIAINDGNKSANGTSAILDEDAYQNLDILVFDINVENIHGFILTSDGLDNELYLKGSSHVNKAAEEYFNAVALSSDPQKIIEKKVAELTADADSPFDDDISIAVISRADHAITFPVDPTWLCSCGSRNRLQDTYCVKCNKDFSLLYQNIRFKEYGGKTAFFLQINQYPSKEQQLVGMAPSLVESVDGNTNKPKIHTQKTNEALDTKHFRTDRAILEYQTGSRGSRKVNEAFNAKAAKKPEIIGGEGKVPKREYTKQQTQRKIIQIMPIACVLSLVIGLIVGVFISRVGLNNRIAKLSDKIDTLSGEIQIVLGKIDKIQIPSLPDDDEKEGMVPAETNPPCTLPDDFLTEENGGKYWGELEDGLPNGKGIKLKNGYYYIGYFKNGEKDGAFQVVSKSASSKPVTVVYQNDVIVIDTATMTACYVRYSTLNVRSEATLSAEVVAELKAGDKIYRTTNLPVNKDGKEWVEVIANDTIGWVVLDAIALENDH